MEDIDRTEATERRKALVASVLADHPPVREFTLEGGVTVQELSNCDHPYYLATADNGATTFISLFQREDGPESHEEYGFILFPDQLKEFLTLEFTRLGWDTSVIAGWFDAED